MKTKRHWAIINPKNYPGYTFQEIANDPKDCPIIPWAASLESAIVRYKYYMDPFEHALVLPDLVIIEITAIYSDLSLYKQSDFSKVIPLAEYLERKEENA